MQGGMPRDMGIVGAFGTERCQWLLGCGLFVGSPVTMFCFSSESGEWKLVKAPVLWSCTKQAVAVNHIQPGRRRIEHRWLKNCTTTRDSKVLVDPFSDRAVYHDFCVGLKVKQLVDSTWTHVTAG